MVQFSQGSVSGVSFVHNIAKFVEKTKGKEAELLKRVAFEASRELIEKTPVDTGTLRNGWRGGINQPIPSEYVPDKSGAAANAQIVTVLKGAKAGDSIFLTNGIHYAKWVEFGTSRMRGRFMVTTTFRNLKKKVEQIAQQLLSEG